MYNIIHSLFVFAIDLVSFLLKFLYYLFLPFLFIFRILYSLIRKRNLRLVIVGGGFSGTYIARALQDDFNIVLLDVKDFFLYTPSLLKIVSNPNIVSRITRKHSSYLRKVEVIQKYVDTITEESIFYDSTELPYDYLAICTGSSYVQTFPFQNNVIRADNIDEMVRGLPLLESASIVLIIGGGIVGVELAGEILDRFKNRKKIIIVQSADRLISRSPPKAIRYAENFFMQHPNVEVKFNEKIISYEEGMFISEQGLKIQADIAYLCTAGKPNSSWAKINFSDSVSETSYIHTTPSLLLENSSNIFVAGDIISWREEKLANSAIYHAKLVVNNILSSVSGYPLKEYVSEPRMMLISLGPYDGIFQYKQYSITGFIPALLKEAVEFKEMIWYW